MSRKKARIVFRVTDADGDQVAIIVGRSPRGAVHRAKLLGHQSARHAHVIECLAAPATYTPAEKSE